MILWILSSWVESPPGARRFHRWRFRNISAACLATSIPPRSKKDIDLDAAFAPRQLRVSRVLDRIDSARFHARSGIFAESLGVRPLRSVA